MNHYILTSKNQANNGYLSLPDEANGLAVFDVDGTVMSEDYKFYAGVPEMLLRLMNNNITCIFVTGRKWSKDHSKCFESIKTFYPQYIDHVYDITKSRKFLGLKDHEKLIRIRLMDFLAKKYGFESLPNQVYLIDDTLKNINQAKEKGYLTSHVQYISSFKPVPTPSYFSDLEVSIYKDFNLMKSSRNKTKYCYHDCVIL